MRAARLYCNWNSIIRIACDKGKNARYGLPLNLFIPEKLLWNSRQPGQEKK
jgi:hypothetical protein